MTIETDPSVTPHSASQSPGLRKNAIGFGALIFLVVSANAPLTTLTGYFPLGVLYGNGPGFIVCYLISFLVLVIFSIGYLRMVMAEKTVGAFYALICRGLGSYAGAASGLIVILSYTCGMMGMQGLLAATASAFLSDQFGIMIPWWGLAIAFTGVIAVLGYRALDMSLAVIGVLVIAEFAIIIAINSSIVIAKPISAVSFDMLTGNYIFSGSIALGAMMAMGSFVGFEATSLYAEEARNPGKSVPRATYASLALIAGFYFVSGFCLIHAVGTDQLMAMLGGLADPSQFMFQISAEYLSPGSVVIVQALVITSTFASVLAFHNATSRYIFNLSRDTLLPGWLSMTHSRFQSPCAASLAVSTLAFAIIGFFASFGLDPILVMFAWLTSIGLLGIIVMMALTATATTLYFLAKRQMFPTITSICACIMLWVIAVAISLNMELFAGATGFAGIFLPGTIVIAAVVGIALALRMRSVNPANLPYLGTKEYR